MTRITLKNVALPCLLTFMSSGFTSHIGIFFLKGVAKLPFVLIYFLADIFYFVLYNVVSYRKKVVIENLKNAFPEKRNDEINQISKKYYHHMADLFLESIKMHDMKTDDFKKRMVMKNMDVLDTYFEKGKSVVVLTMHYNNWEWSNSFPLYVKHKILGVYKPLHNRHFDKFTNDSRKNMGAELIQNSQVLRRVVNAERNNEPVFVWLAGDQTPPPSNKLWFRFLNQEAVFYSGPAFISKKFNYPVFFQKVEKISRGKYQTCIELLYENPAEVSEVEIMKTYIQKMEQTIREAPEFYLWSHKRWKHQRPDDQPLLN